MKILILEDSDTDARLIAAALREGLGKDVVLERVSTVKAACEAAAGGGLSAALVDLTVDDSLGLTTLGRLRAAAPALPIIVVSGESDDLIRQEALSAGAVAFFSKGAFSPASLAEAVKSAVG